MERKSRAGAAWGGLSLIGLGVVLLLARWVGWDEMWPIFPLVGGLAFFVGFAVGGFRDDGLVFAGTLGVLVGLFFFGFTLGYWEWGEMERLWPVFPLIGGVAFCALFLAQRKHDLGALGVGLAALIVGGVGLAYTYRYVSGDVVRFWPLLIVLLGVLLLVGGLLRMVRRQ